MLTGLLSRGSQGLLNLYKFLQGCDHLFFQSKFSAHRLLGLLYLVQWVAALFLYFANYPLFKDSWLVATLPLNGVVQSITASYYFTFLPKNKKTNDPGYYSDKRSLSYPFIVENIFFSSLLAFQWLYYSDFYKQYIPYVLELFFVFLPYSVRFLFPQTRFRDAVNNADKNRSAENYTFYKYGTYLTKAFYIWAKHFIGFYLNYFRFLDRQTAQHQYHMYLMLICACFSTTISLFLHTLAIKHYISRSTSFTIYVMSYLSTFYSWYNMRDVLSFANLDLILLTLGGVLINFKPRSYQIAYQVLILALLASQRAGYHQIMPLSTTALTWSQ